MVNKKFVIKWHSPYCENELVLTLSNVHEFVGALRVILEEDGLKLSDVTAYEY